MIKKFKDGWIRNTNEEDKPTYHQQVFRWYEKPEQDIIVSVVEGYFPTELNVRFSGNDFESFETRGHKSVMENRNDEDFIQGFEMMLRRKIGVV